MDGILTRRWRDGDGCGDAAVPSYRQRRRLRRGRGTTQRDERGGGATTRDKRQVTTARQGTTLRSLRHCGDARGLVIYEFEWEVGRCSVEEVKKPVPLFLRVPLF